MNVVNFDGNFVEINDWDDIASLPGFVMEVDLAEEGVESTKVIGAYRFKESVNCGLKSCHKPHNKGYVIGCPDGRKTNVGNICGLKHYGAEFEESKRLFDREAQAYIKRIEMEEISHRLPGLIKRVGKLVSGEGGVLTLVCALEYIKDKTPIRVSREIEKMLKARSGKIERARLLTKEEQDSWVVQQGQDPEHYGGYVPESVMEVAGNIDGFETWVSSRQIGKLAHEAKQVLRTAKTINVDRSTHEDIKHCVRRVHEVESNIARMEKWLLTAVTLFDRDNLLRLNMLTNDRDEKKQTKSTVKEALKLVEIHASKAA